MSNNGKKNNLSEREKLNCRDVEDRAKAAEKRCYDPLKKLADCNGDYLYTFKHRTKTTEKIINKAEDYRKDNPTHTFDPYKITDAWACRYVLLSQEHIINIFQKLISLIMTDSPVDDIDSPFKKGSLEKLVIYDNRPKNDPLAITPKIEKILSDGGFNIDPDRIVTGAKESGYSSVHIVALVPVKYVNLDRGETPDDVPVEIQVRDVFEDAWCEFEHKMAYSAKDDREGEDRPALSDPIWRQHLNVFKVFVDGCSLYAALLHQNEKRYSSFEGPKSDSAPLTLPEEDRDYVVSILRKQKADSNVIAMVKSSYDQLKKVQEQRLKLADPSYQMLVRKFAETIEACTGHLDNKFRSGYSVRYFLESERLLALMKTTDSELPEGLEDGYKKLFSEFPNDPILAFRKGQVLCQKTELEDYLLAVTVLEDALKKINTPLRPSHIGDEGFNFLRDAIPVQIGLACGLIYEKYLKTKPEEARKYWDKGVQCNKEVIQRYEDEWQEALNRVRPDHCRVLGRAVNNLLDFFFDKEKGTGTIGACIFNKRTPDWDEDRVKQLLVCLCHPHLAEFCGEYSTQDTIMVAHAFLGERDLAVGKAVTIMDELHNRAKSYSGSTGGIQPSSILGHLKSNDERSCYKRASEIQLLLTD